MLAHSFFSAKRKGHMRGYAKQFITLAGLALLAYVWLYPLVPLTLGSLKVLGRLLPPSVQAWTLNSLTVTTLHTVFQVCVSLLAAYALARLEFYGKRLVATLILFGLLIPEMVTLMPLYLLVRRLELHNTYAALVLPGLASPLAVFLLTVFFRSIPYELQEAAFLDGASHWNFMTRILLPLSFPAVVLVALFGFIAHWNSFLWPSLVALERDLWTLTVAAGKANSVSAFNAAFTAALPLMIVFALVQHRVFNRLSTYTQK